MEIDGGTREWILCAALLAKEESLNGGKMNAWLPSLSGWKPWCKLLPDVGYTRRIPRKYAHLSLKPLHKTSQVHAYLSVRSLLLSFSLVDVILFFSPLCSVLLSKLSKKLGSLGPIFWPTGLNLHSLRLGASVLLCSSIVLCSPCRPSSWPSTVAFSGPFKESGGGACEILGTHPLQRKSQGSVTTQMLGYKLRGSDFDLFNQVKIDTF